MTEHFPNKEETYRILGACFAGYNEFVHLPKVEHERFLSHRLSDPKKAI